MTPRSTAPLQRYVAFLRAINVGGRFVKMEVLRAEFEALRFRDVATFIASGNVLFSAPSGDASALEQRIERRLEKSLGYEVATFLRTPGELGALVQDEPYPERAESDTLWIGFVRSPVSAGVRTALRALGSDVEEVDARGREVFWLRRGVEMAALRTGAKIDRALAAPVTFRNVTTVRKLASLTAPDAT